MMKISNEHFTLVPAKELQPTDSIVLNGWVGTINRIEPSGEGFVLFPICFGEATPWTSERAGRCPEGWIFPRFRKSTLVKVYTPRFCGGRSLELRRKFGTA